jgi:hypothetical protein
MSEEKNSPVSLLDDIIRADEVFVYVNPLKGKHISINNKTKTLAVFKDEQVGRQYEAISHTLKKSVGYYVLWNEMLDIASQECEGRYDLFKCFDY